MADTVIVALPSADEKVNKISSEKQAHLTILYLGDQSNNEQLPEIMEYVQHAASMLNPFYATVDHRGELGADLADVLFFEENGWSIKDVRRFRYHLLQNDAIRRAYDSVTQFPEWTPHLTLGYPEAPAIVDPDDDPPHFYGIHFDRIALWVGDFQGPEFRLKYEEHESDMAVGWSDMSAAEKGAFAANKLFHYGVKGMKWGVTTKDRATSITTSSEKQSRLARAAKDPTVTQRKAGTYVKAKGGQRQKADQDAVKTQANRQVAKKSTTDALSNKQLKETIERMRLEQEFRKLDSKVSRKGRSFATRFLESPAAKQAAEDLLKKASTK